MQGHPESLRKDAGDTADSRTPPSVQDAEKGHCRDGERSPARSPMRAWQYTKEEVYESYDHVLVNETNQEESCVDEMHQVIHQHIRNLSEQRIYRTYHQGTIERGIVKVETEIMIHPSYLELMQVDQQDIDADEAPLVNSRYSIVLATSKRARQDHQRCRTVCQSWQETAVDCRKRCMTESEDLSGGFRSRRATEQKNFKNCKSKLLRVS